VLLATRKNGTRDGQLIVVRKDRAAWADASGIAANLQAALDDWGRAAPQLEALQADLDAGHIDGRPIVADDLHSPLPRAYEWIDGSAYLNHVRLVRKARNAEPPPTLETDPLVYQGGSGTFLAPTDPIPFLDAAYGLDFEAEVCVVLDDTPLGTQAAEALKYVRLVMICNDVSLRGLIPNELKKGFGFFQGKPSTAFAPIALTPDELGPAWQEGRIHLPMTVHLNGERVGWCDAGPEMHFGFAQLIEHVTRTRALTAGTILGSGTVSNEDQAHGISCLAEARMIEIIRDGKPSTRFMEPGDAVRIEVRDDQGVALFGTIEQRVVAQ
jgi:fumarylacetoacetate (FAA) hydrolase